jgi:hypothetical protein
LPDPAGVEHQQRRRSDQGQHAADARRPHLEPGFLFKSTRVSTLASLDPQPAKSGAQSPEFRTPAWQSAPRGDIARIEFYPGSFLHSRDLCVISRKYFEGLPCKCVLGFLQQLRKFTKNRSKIRKMQN